MAQAILRQKKGMAGGGIIAFKQGDPVDEEIARAYNAPRETPRDVAEQRAAAVTGSNRPGTSSPPPRAAAPNPRAITAVPTQGQAQAQAGPLMDFSGYEKLISDQQTQADAKRALADRPQSDFIAEAKAGRKELGLDQNEALATQRANVMAEKANLKDEAEYKRKMTLVKFFAAWGSTPGDTLVAGMKQFEKIIPEMVQNVDDEKKAKKETDKVIYELDNAVRLEKMGLYNEAAASKIKAAELANAIAEQVRKSQEAMLKAKEDAAKTTAEIKGRRDVADTQARSAANVAGIGAAGHANVAAATREAKTAAQMADLFKDAGNKIKDAENSFVVDNSKKTSAYHIASETINRHGGKEKLDRDIQTKLDLARKTVADIETAHKTKITQLELRRDAIGKKYFGAGNYDAMTTSGSPTAPPPDYVLDNKK